MSEAQSTDGDLQPAATVLLVRDGVDGVDGVRGVRGVHGVDGVDRAETTTDGLELLLVRRNSKIAFGGAWAFPGGRVDQHESDRAAGDDLAAARLAAVREVEEETSLRVDPSALIPWSHWTPPPNQPRRFATWFFVCPAPAGEVVIDDGEIKASDWLRPADALARHLAGDIELFPPTWVTLNQLSAYPSVEALRAAAADRVANEAVDRFVTRILAKKPLTLGWVEDAGYEVGSADVPGARHRITLDGTNWRYERTLAA